MVGYIRYLNNLVVLPVPTFCLRFLTLEIHNFSNHVLSYLERYLFSLGLNFRPTPRVLPINQQLDFLLGRYVLTIMLLFTHIHIVNCMLSLIGTLRFVLLGLSFLCQQLD